MLLVLFENCSLPLIFHPFPLGNLCAIREPFYFTLWSDMESQYGTSDSGIVNLGALYSRETLLGLFFGIFQQVSAKIVLFWRMNMFEYSQMFGVTYDPEGLFYNKNSTSNGLMLSKKLDDEQREGNNIFRELLFSDSLRDSVGTVPSGRWKGRWTVGRFSDVDFFLSARRWQSPAKQDVSRWRCFPVIKPRLILAKLPKRFIDKVSFFLA